MGRRSREADESLRRLCLKFEEKLFQEGPRPTENGQDPAAVGSVSRSGVVRSKKFLKVMSVVLREMGQVYEGAQRSP